MRQELLTDRVYITISQPCAALLIIILIIIIIIIIMKIVYINRVKKNLRQKDNSFNFDSSIASDLIQVKLYDRMI